MSAPENAPLPAWDDSPGGVPQPPADQVLSAPAEIEPWQAAQLPQEAAPAPDAPARAAEDDGQDDEDDQERGGLPAGQWLAGGAGGLVVGGQVLWQTLGALGLAAGGATVAGGAALYAKHRWGSRDKGRTASGRTVTTKTVTTKAGGGLLGGRGGTSSRLGMTGGAGGRKSRLGGLGGRAGTGGARPGSSARTGTGRTSTGAKAAGARGATAGKGTTSSRTGQAGQGGRAGQAGQSGRPGQNGQGQGQGQGQGRASGQGGHKAAQSGSQRSADGRNSSRSAAGSTGRAGQTRPEPAARVGRWHAARRAAMDNLTGGRRPKSWWGRACAQTVGGLMAAWTMWRSRTDASDPADSAPSDQDRPGDARQEQGGTSPNAPNAPADGTPGTESSQAAQGETPDPVRDPRTIRNTNNRRTRTMSSGGFPIAVAAAEMNTAAATYEPADMWEVAADLNQLPDVFASVALALRTFTQRLEGQYPIDPNVVQEIGGLYVAVAQIASAAQDIGPLFRKVHEADLQRQDAPRTNERAWNV